MLYLFYISRGNEKGERKQRVELRLRKRKPHKGQHSFLISNHLLYLDIEITSQVNTYILISISLIL